MKMRITDVRKIIQEIIAEANPSFERHYKYPTLEEQLKIQREFGMKINFEDCISHPQAEDFDRRWSKEFESTEKPLMYYIVGLNAKDVYSTLDDGYALMVASMNYSNPFGKPSEYKAVAYGPKELMKQIEYTIKLSISENYSTGNITAFTNNYLKRTDFYEVVGEIFYKKLLRHAQDKKVKVIPGPKNTIDHITITFQKYEDIDPIANIALFELKKIVASEYPHITVRLDFEKSGHGLTATFFNKYTGMKLGIINFNNITVRYYTGRNVDWDDEMIDRYGDEPF